MNSIDKILMGCENINHFNSSFHSQKRDVYISSTEVLHYSFGYYYDRSHFKGYFYTGTGTSTFWPYMVMFWKNTENLKMEKVIEIESFDNLVLKGAFINCSSPCVITIRRKHIRGPCCVP